MKILERVNFGWGRKLPSIMQTEAAECGLACLAMMVSHYDMNVGLSDLRRKYGLSLKGATLEEIVRIADQLGMAARPLRLELDELPELRMPCILHWDLTHFVVLEGIGRQGATIHDPAVGVRVLPLAEVSRHFTGIALELSPTERFKPVAAAPRVRLSQLVSRMVGLKRTLGYLLSMALAIELFAMVSPLFLGWVVDQALVAFDHDLLTTLSLGFGLLVLLQIFVSTARSWMLLGLNVSMKVQARANLFTHLVNLPTSYFEARHLGDVMSRFGSQEVILQAITTELIEAMLDGLMTLITLLVMLAFAPDLTIVVVAGAALYALLRWAAYTPLRQASVEAIGLGARRDSHFLETLRGIRTIKLANGQEARRARWLNLLVETINRQLTADKLRLMFKTANRFLMEALRILVIFLGARKVLDGALSVGILLAFIVYKDQFIERVSSLTDKLVDLTMLRLHAERLADIALSEPEPRGLLNPKLGSDAPARLELRDIRFRYAESEPWILDGVNIVFHPGESVAIVGQSGGGKTTLMKIIAGLLQPTHGEILVNGRRLSQLGLENYRAMLGVVMQDDQLFAGSVADNISFFDERPDLGLIERSARDASVHDEVAAMAMGYDSLIGDMGTTLSGGQKQRVIIARALYREPNLLLLDEATSHLDVDREREVNATLKSLNVTRVVIAHRPETIRASDRIVALRHGKIFDGLATAQRMPAR